MLASKKGIHWGKGSLFYLFHNLKKLYFNDKKTFFQSFFNDFFVYKMHQYVPLR